MEIPGYKILKTLGQGGMATVYLAIQESFDRKVALKVMSAQLAQDPAFGDRFQREARIVSQMNHPNIVTVYDVGVVDNHHYLAMQYIDGKELRYRFDAMSLAEKIRVVRELASALHYAGNKGYVHRDVKPENVMMSDEDGRAILMDFGIAKAADGNHSMTKTGMTIGTPYYMSPEQAQGRAVDKRSDLYSLGVLFFQLLTGQVPYDAESGVAIGIKHVTEPVPMLPRHLRVFQPILEKIMAKDPDKRYQSGAEVIRDLDSIDMGTLDQVDKILQQEIYKVSATDPHAHTVFTEAEPPVLSTGNVTTADAARLAQRISAGEPLSRRKKSGALPAVLALAVVASVLAGGWYFLQQQHPAPEPATSPSSGLDADIPAEAASTELAVEMETPVEASPVASEQALPAPAASAAAMAAQREEEETQVRLAAEQAEQQRLAAERAADVAKEKARQEELARARKEAEAKEAVAKTEQAKRDEVARRLAYAKSLHERGALVTPEKDNAVLAYRAVLEVDPGNAAAVLALKTIEANYLLGIRTLMEQGEQDQALDQLRSASKLYPDSAPINELLVLNQQKKAEKEMASPVVPQAAVTRLVVNDAAFDSLQLSQKSHLLLNRTAYIGFSYEHFQAATTLLQVTLYDSSRTVKIMQKPIVAAGAAGNIFVTLARPVEGFPEGGYTVDLMSGEERMATVSFTVSH